MCEAVVQSPNNYAGLVRDHHSTGCIFEPFCATGAGVVGSVASFGTSGIFRSHQGQIVDMRSIQHNGELQHIGVNFSFFLANNTIGLFLRGDRLLINCVILTFPRIFTTFSGRITDLAEAHAGHQQLTACRNRQNATFRNFHCTILTIRANHNNRRHIGLGCFILVFSRCTLGLNGDCCRNSCILRMDLHYSKAHIRSLYRECEIAVSICVNNLIEQLDMTRIRSQNNTSAGHRIAIGIKKSSLQSYTLCRFHHYEVVCGFNLRNILLNLQFVRDKGCTQCKARIVLHGSVYSYLHSAGQRFTVHTGNHQFTAIIHICIRCADFPVGECQYTGYILTVYRQCDCSVEAIDIHVLAELHQHTFRITVYIHNFGCQRSHQANIDIQLGRRHRQPAIHGMRIHRGIRHQITVFLCHYLPVTGRRQPGVVTTGFGEDGAGLTIVFRIPQDGVTVFIFIVDADSSALYTVGKHGLVDEACRVDQRIGAFHHGIFLLLDD